jgi:hypothetical protein
VIGEREGAMVSVAAKHDPTELPARLTDVGTPAREFFLCQP